MTEKTFPISHMMEFDAEPYPSRIPWSIAELAYSGYKAKFSGQSLERLAERGGFAPSEMDMWLPDWRERCSEIAQLKARVAELEQQLADTKDT